MKHLLIMALALFTFGVSAQQQEKEGRNKRSFKSDFTPEQIATLQTKKMALSLDLDKAQQLKIHKLNLDNANERQARKESSNKELIAKKERLSSEERFNLKNARLDKALAHKTEMNSILNKEQYAKWEKGRQHKQLKSKQMNQRKMMKRKRMNRVKKRP